MHEGSKPERADAEYASDTDLLTEKIFQEKNRSELRIKDKALISTVENAIDRRTRLLLFKFLSTGVLDSIYGCVSTGKEANVYSAVTGCNFYTNLQIPSFLQPFACQEDHSTDVLALKVFKTVALSFRDRDRYIDGDIRFKNGYRKGSSRDMVILWTEKEFRNLRRLAKIGVPVPFPYYLKKNVLIMKFIGTNHKAAPLLKDVVLPSSEWLKLYLQVCRLMRKMYRDANLVHGDLSEYNLMYHDGELIIIDVSQAVENDHPSMGYFLYRDCKNVCLFFKSRIGEDTNFSGVLTDNDQEEALLSFAASEVFQYVLQDEKKLGANLEGLVGTFEAVHLENELDYPSEDEGEAASFSASETSSENSNSVDFSSEISASEEDVDKVAPEAAQEVSQELKKSQRKQWKKYVKENARLRRQQKIPKKVKRRKEKQNKKKK